MRRIILLVLIFACLAVTPTNAGPGGCTNAGSLFPFAFEQITVSSTALGFTVATFSPAGQKPADLAVLDVETNAIRYRADGLNPSATVGQPAAAASSLTVCGEAAIRRVRFIRQSADATISVHYYRMGDQ